MSDERENKENPIKNLIELGSDLSGSISGSVIGGLVAGPLGLVIGGASGPIITRILKKIGNELRNRSLGKREEVRIGAAYAFAIRKIQANEQKGLTLRSDDFFDRKKNNRSSAEEVFEGTVLSAQKEYEERKVQYIGNLYGNICSNQEVSREFAHQLIKIASNLTYRQFCLLRLLHERSLNNYPLDTRDIIILDLTLEIRDLQQKRLVIVIELISPGRNDSTPLKYNSVKITRTGVLLSEMLALDEIDKQQLDKVENEIGEKSQ